MSWPYVDPYTGEPYKSASQWDPSGNEVARPCRQKKKSTHSNRRPERSNLNTQNLQKLGSTLRDSESSGDERVFNIDGQIIRVTTKYDDRGSSHGDRTPQPRDSHRRSHKQSQPRAQSHSSQGSGSTVGQGLVPYQPPPSSSTRKPASGKPRRSTSNHVGKAGITISFPGDGTVQIETGNTTTDSHGGSEESVPRRGRGKIGNWLKQADGTGAFGTETEPARLVARQRKPRKGATPLSPLSTSQAAAQQLMLEWKPEYGSQAAQSPVAVSPTAAPAGHRYAHRNSRDERPSEPLYSDGDSNGPSDVDDYERGQQRQPVYRATAAPRHSTSRRSESNSLTMRPKRPSRTTNIDSSYSMRRLSEDVEGIFSLKGVERDSTEWNQCLTGREVWRHMLQFKVLDPRFLTVWAHQLQNGMVPVARKFVLDLSPSVDDDDWDPVRTLSQDEMSQMLKRVLQRRIGRVMAFTDDEEQKANQQNVLRWINDRKPHQLLADYDPKVLKTCRTLEDNVGFRR